MSSLWKNSRILFAIVWLLVTVSLGVWWFLLGLKLTNTVAGLSAKLNSSSENLSILERQSRMIKMEGAFFLLMLFLGGATLIWFSYRETRRNKLIHDFFSTVTHEMKTPLASLRLQAESLQEEMPSLNENKLIHRLLMDSVRIESQMNRAMYLASLTKSEILYIEKANVREIFLSIGEDFPELKIDLSRLENVFVSADRKALESIFKNLAENSLKHGKARVLEVISEKQKSNRILITISDNGTGFDGKYKVLGIPFYRHGSTSGTGIGLYIIKKLMKKMKGDMRIVPQKIGFRVDLNFPGAI
ncbi:sensor histidine kinase [Leptospira borgpetersenii]|uniref:histidine kinase n=2 Tax=Leptospira borgpetersenii serovar Hardjo-bovis TaxID=338217 RepID=Q04NV3_LEPBJ|nr:HAMP domain-containing sensor histidine kinase [Leptospira borgpetersenii]ABJ77417.1 Sensor protein of a two component response regulator [Leptospira borgpetersenii serovar Hardjo-bovis str. JB197]ABJ80355.1 Sensor protein of a two component response regulator [Leptospira borgpetersenii serovar Hardjo-bovis str. L550]AMX60043.1 histidine kinase [Leptospira borgpetersenii serovar Hardjo]AMX63273.1 histidine kinase [Leptospira borgpetersenii serovar Hardjo]AMX66517.1 histidine kinase [Leptosp